MQTRCLGKAPEPSGDRSIGWVESRAARLAVRCVDARRHSSLPSGAIES